MIIQTASNAKYMNVQGDEIDLIVKFEEMEHELPFTARPVDSEDYCVDLFNNAVAGLYGDIAPYIPPPPPSEPEA
jgi:hypothetical protein